MKTLNRNRLLGTLFVAVMTTAGSAAADQAPPAQPQTAQPKADQPPIVGAQPLGVTVEMTGMVAKGWSARKNLVGKPIYNDKNEKIGTIDDIIISPDKTASFAIIGAGGFVGLDRHDVAVPFAQIDMTGTRMMLPNASKDAIKSLPQFQYAK